MDCTLNHFVCLHNQTKNVKTLASKSIALCIDSLFYITYQVSYKEVFLNIQNIFFLNNFLIV